LSQSAEISNVDLQRIAGANGNYQAQINSINATVSGIVPSLYADKAGDALGGTWKNIGRISAVNIKVSGTTPQPSSDALFAHDYQGGEFKLSTSSMAAPLGLTVERLGDGGGSGFRERSYHK
jgi:hypothetical protein